MGHSEDERHRETDKMVTEKGREKKGMREMHYEKKKETEEEKRK